MIRWISSFSEFMATLLQGAQAQPLTTNEHVSKRTVLDMERSSQVFLSSMLELCTVIAKQVPYIKFSVYKVPQVR